MVVAAVVEEVVDMAEAVVMEEDTEVAAEAVDTAVEAFKGSGYPKLKVSSLLSTEL